MSEISFLLRFDGKFARRTLAYRHPSGSEGSRRPVEACSGGKESFGSASE